MHCVSLARMQCWHIVHSRTVGNIIIILFKVQKQITTSRHISKLVCNYDVIQFVQHRVFNSKLEAS